MAIFRNNHFLLFVDVFFSVVGHINKGGLNSIRDQGYQRYPAYYHPLMGGKLQMKYGYDPGDFSK